MRRYPLVVSFSWCQSSLVRLPPGRLAPRSPDGLQLPRRPAAGEPRRLAQQLRQLDRVHRLPGGDQPGDVIGITPAVAVDVAALQLGPAHAGRLEPAGAVDGEEL